MVGLTESRVLRIERDLDTYTARAHAREMAQDVGFCPTAAAEIEIAVAELTQNIVRHGVRGLTVLRRSTRRIEIVCRDEGPGFAATRGKGPSGLGIGLDGARRLMDLVTVEDLPQGGAQVRAQRSLPVRREEKRRSGMDVRLAVAMRPATGELQIGDVYAAASRGERDLVAVIDGLGHGEAAHTAAQAVRGYLLTHLDEPSLVELLRGAHLAAGQTRGAVALLVSLAPGGLIQVAGLGNVRVIDIDGGTRIAGTPGCLGVRWREPHVAQIQVRGRYRMVVCSDGVTQDVSRLVAQASPRFIVEQAAAESDGRDDALAALIDVTV